ncbi:hypothetical protein [Novosphingobium resinovorum]|uniref:L,D-transpeptidase n=1 Tax=Novosphingobium resinovorum TaxID=158500 RepID=A0A1D8A5A1_9SPHN|nr:hypothetical protein [Novosphingobium resinovorum]AOR77280.1 hypothetical protein BES08_11370 [Novosphingobium resinovorum]
MSTVSRALAGLFLTGAALTGSAPAWAAQVSRSAGPKTSQTQETAEPSPAIQPQDATRVADWIAASGDNNALPYAIVDKKAAALLLFDAKGKKLGQVPVLLGIAPGDDASPGIGSKNLSEIGPAEKTTPAGRFLARFGVAAGNTRVLWVDYATSVALHPIPRPGKPKEKRRERMLSPTSDDNRITFGCINVPIAFYTKTISPLFRKKGGYVYVTPDVKPLEEVFPRIRLQSFANTGG